MSKIFVENNLCISYLNTPKKISFLTCRDKYESCIINDLYEGDNVQKTGNKCELCLNYILHVSCKNKRNKLM